MPAVRLSGGHGAVLSLNAVLTGLPRTGVYNAHAAHQALDHAASDFCAFPPHSPPDLARAVAEKFSEKTRPILFQRSASRRARADGL